MTTCPTPSKSKYATREGAEAAARRVQIGVGQILNPYGDCPCGWWHLTRQDGALPVNAQPKQADVDRLVAMTDEEFRAVVKADAIGKAGRAYRLALRHRDNLQRWRLILRGLNFDLDKQFMAKATDRSPEANEWRTRAYSYRATIAQRRDECQRLRQQAHLEVTQEAQAAKAARREAEAERQQQNAEQRAAKADQKELRRTAGERAIDRLIDAHGREFSRYLAEECERIGAELPNRVRKYLEPARTGAAA